MSKFDKVIESLQETIAEIDEEWDCVQPQGLKAKQEYDNLIEQYKQAIATLESYPKWEPLIEAAKKMDKKMVLYELNYIENVLERVALYINIDLNSQIRALLESIPEEKK